MNGKPFLIFYFLFLFFIHGGLGVSSAFAGCRFKEKRPVLSFSGPVSHLLYQLGLFGDDSLKMISVFHGFTKNDFKGKIVGGGLFLSPKVFLEYRNLFPLIFYDENREQKKVLTNLPGKKEIVSVSTLGDPFSVHERTLFLVRPYLEGCEVLLAGINKTVEGIRKKLLEAPPFNNPFLFYLGKLEDGKRAPNLLMVMDGPVQFWVNEGKMITYPSSLHYVSPADKIVSELEKKYPSLLKVGLLGERRRAEQEIYEMIIIWMKGKAILNIYHPSFLVPGLSQVLFMRDFVLNMESLRPEK